ncbi:MAG: hypothetical protein IH874_06360 [Candidatus Dadabacteria bacterium]|nr:hypothetical protein [Candidatus Dadabacteria bacterium]
MENLLDKLAQGFTAVVILGALGFVGIIAAVALFGPKLAPLFQGLPF